MTLNDLTFVSFLHCVATMFNTVSLGGVPQILTVFANDGQRLFDGVTMIPMLIGGLVLALGATAVAIYLLGLWALLGYFILIFLFPLQVTGMLQ